MRQSVYHYYSYEYIHGVLAEACRVLDSTWTCIKAGADTNPGRRLSPGIARHRSQTTVESCRATTFVICRMQFSQYTKY